MGQRINFYRATIFFFLNIKPIRNVSPQYTALRDSRSRCGLAGGWNSIHRLSRLIMEDTDIAFVDRMLEDHKRVVFVFVCLFVCVYVQNL